MSRRLALVVALLGAGCGRAEGEVVVFTAASAGNVVREVARDTEAAGGGPVVTSVAASGTLARQVRQGALADVLVLADPAWADWLESEDVEVLDRAVLARARLVWVEPVGVPPRRSLAEAVGAARRLAVGDPAFVPAGAYARDALRALGLWDRVADRVIPQADVRAALAAVETGAADAAVVYASDARLSTRVAVTADVPSKRPIRVEGVLLSLRGRAVFEALRAEAGVWAAHGFDAP